MPHTGIENSASMNSLGYMWKETAVPSYLGVEPWDLKQITYPELISCLTFSYMYKKN